MLDNLWFWTSWPKRERILLYVLLLFSLIAGCVLVFSYFSGNSLVLDWIDATVSKPLRILYDQYNVGLYKFSIFADNYIIEKSFHSSDISVNLIAGYIFLAVFCLSLVFLLSLATTVSRFYFIAFCAIFIVILISLKLENILLFGWFGRQTLFLVMALFLLPAYYLHAFKSEVHLVYRFLILSGIAVIVFLLIYFFAEAELPFFYIVSYGIISPLIISVIFILMLGFEVVKGFLTVVTKNSSGEGKMNLIHFLTLSLIYIAVLVFIFLYNEGYIAWKIVFVNAVWILIAASAIGFWGFKDKQSTYSHIFNFRPVGAALYLVLMVICFSTFAYFYASANDPMVEVIEDAVIYTQLSFGVLFVVYVMANFFPAIMEGMQAYKIVYKPKFMPYISAVLASFIGVLALFFVSHKITYYQTFSGYYISLANLHMLQDDEIIARQYYELSNIYGRQTHFGNFALAKMADKKGNSNEEENYLARSLNKNPTEFAFADLAKIYTERSNFFDALFVLKHGVSYFPDSGPLNNNLGNLLSKTKVLDSAAYYYLKAADHKKSSVAALTNLYALYAKANLEMGKDSLQNLISENQPVSVESNMMAMAAEKNYVDLSFNRAVTFDEGINIDNLVYNFNSLLYHPYDLDSAAWKSYRRFYERTSSFLFKDELDYAFAMAYAKNNHSLAAMRIFNMANTADSYGYKKYDLLMAQYLMKYGASLQALDHYENTYKYYGSNVLAEMGLALMEAGKLDDARIFWSHVMEANDSTSKDIAQNMLTLLNYNSFKDIVDKGDATKYNFLRYRYRDVSLDEYEGIVLSIEDPELQVASYLELLRHFLDDDRLTDAERIVNKIALDEIQNLYLKNTYLRELVVFYVKNRDAKAIEKLFPQLESQQLQPYFLLAQATDFELTGYYDKASESYEQLGAMDVFCDECVLQSARYLENNGQNKMKSYGILVNAIEINKYSVPLNKAYVDIALELGLDSYVDDVLDKLENVLLPRDFSEFKNFVDSAKTTHSQSEAW